MTTQTQTPPSPDIAGLVERLTEIERQSTAPYFGPRKYWQSIIKDLVRECRRLLAANEVWFDDARNAFLETEVERLTAERDEAQADHIVDADDMVETVTSHGEADKLAHILHGMVNRRTAIDHEAIERALHLAKYRQDPAEEDREWAVTEGAIIAPLPELSGNPGGLREKVAEAINRAMIDGQGDQDIIHLATDDILAIPEIAALQAGEGR